MAAGLALAGAVRSTLGPKGLDKLLVDNQGRTMVTNDGVTVLRTAKVEHPIAKMIISASETQEKSVSDGTTSTVILCAELLRNAWYLVSQGVHPSVVSRGYSMAENYAMSELHSLKLEAPSMEVVRTVLEGKLNSESRELLSKLAVEAADSIYDEVSNKSDSTRVKKLQLTGNSVSGTKLISGLMVAKTCVHPEMNANLSNGNILLIDGGIEREYIYYHPSSASENCPLVFVCHGYTGTAQGIMNYSGFNQLADEYGFAVCYPQGTQDGGGNTFFNVGYDFQNNETVDDVAFIQNLNTYFQNTYSLAADKVFCTGMSNGGDLCYMLACQASETFRAVAPVAGMIMQNIMDDCTPSNEVSILEIQPWCT